MRGRAPGGLAPQGPDPRGFVRGAARVTPRDRHLGDLDLHLLGEGRHERLWQALGAHVQPEGGTRFAVWAPNARAVSVVGDWNGWEGKADPLAPTGSSGVWAGVAGAGEGDAYKYAVLGADGVLREKADPFACHAEVPPATASSACATAASATPPRRLTHRPLPPCCRHWLRPEGLPRPSAVLGSPR